MKPAPQRSVRPQQANSATCTGQLWRQGRWRTVAPLDEADEGEEEISIEEAEDVEPLRMAKDPRLPSAADVELHDRTHVPYRTWCKWCNMGRGRGVPHTHSRGSSVPIVGVDYFFITGDGWKKRKELPFEKTPEGERRNRVS